MRSCVTMPPSRSKPTVTMVKCIHWLKIACWDWRQVRLLNQSRLNTLHRPAGILSPHMIPLTFTKQNIYITSCRVSIITNILLSQCSSSTTASGLKDVRVFCNIYATVCILTALRSSGIFTVSLLR